MPDNVRNNETTIRKKVNTTNKMQVNSKAEAQPQTPSAVPDIQEVQPASSSNTAGLNTGKGQQTNFLEFTPDKVLQGILYSEILGKPKSLRRRRW